MAKKDAVINKQDGSVEESAVENVAVCKVTKTYKRKKLLTRPALSLKNAGSEYAVKIVSPIRIAEVNELENANEVKQGRKPKDPPKLCDVIDLETGAEAIIVCPSMIVSEFEKNYPDDSYVGLCFLIRNEGKKESKNGDRYNQMYLEEIEPD
jgi:hypothetical protein